MNYSTFNVIRRAIREAKGFYPHIIFLFLLSLTSTPIALLKPLALKLLIDSGFGSHPVPHYIKVLFPNDFAFTFSTVAVTAACFYIFIAFLENMNGVITWVFEIFTGERIVRAFKAKLFNHIQRISLAYHDKKGTSDALYRLQSDTGSIRSLMMGNLTALISSFISLCTMVGVMFIINWRFALISLCVIPLLLLITRASTKRQKGWKKVKEDESKAISVVHEVLNSLRVVKAFGQEEYESQRFFNRSSAAIKGQVKMAWIGSFFYFIVGMLFACSTALFIFIGAKYVHSGQMTLGELTMAIAYLGQIYSPLQSLTRNITNVQASAISMERVLTLLDQDKEVTDDSDAEHLSRARGSFEFQNVSFYYEKDKPVLQEVCFKINEGDRVGIMGSTGSGKSTLMSLLIRFYDATGGAILIDGHDIKRYKLKDYRKQFSIVLQEPVLFSTSIAENIRYGKPDATEQEVIEAAKAANAHEFILRCKDGYESLVGERGMQLSGGERQRISLARAFIKNAPVLILDEPTSSLDIKTEFQIMEALERLMKGRTTFMITHRLDTLNTCNVILHLESGRLVEVVREQKSEFLMRKKQLFTEPLTGIS